MFTGIVEEVGHLVSREGSRYTFASDRGLVTEDAKVGDSIAVSGCCLTVIEVDQASFSAELVGETLGRTTLGALAEGDPVNLERAMQLSDRLGGHLVAGHVDAVGVVMTVEPTLRIQAPSTVLVAAKGSIAVDGVSLTVVDLDEQSFTVAVIPHTAEVTTIGRLWSGARVNLEFDLVARHIQRLMRAGEP